MRRQITLAIVAGLVFGAWCARAGADDKEQHQAQIRAIVEAWRARQAQVKTLTCTTSVDSFYSKGYVSDLAKRFYYGKSKPATYDETRIVPDADKTFVNDSTSWALDFTSQRVRKEYQRTEAYTTGETFFVNRSLELFADGKYKVFHPKDMYPKTEDKSIATDVVLYEDAAHSFVLGGTDLPLLWAAGGVSGQNPKPEEMQFLDRPDRFTWRGEAQRDGHDCVILTTQEQQSPTAVREFWIGKKDPYPIYYCRPRNGARVMWQLEIEYNDPNRPGLPTKWVGTDYNLLGKSFERNTYTVRDIAINTPLSAELFQKKLEPGQTVLDVEKHKKLEVSNDGALVPLNPVKGSTGALWIIFWNVVALAVLTIGFFTWRRFRRRSKV